MEEADLGVGDLGERLAVHPDDLQEGDEREAGRQGPAAVVLWDQAVAGPSPQGCRRDARAAGRLGERDLAHAGVGCSGHAATLSLAAPASSGGTASWTDPAASRALRPAASATALVVRPAAPRGRVSVHYGLVPRWVRAA